MNFATGLNKEILFGSFCVRSFCSRFLHYKTFQPISSPPALLNFATVSFSPISPFLPGSVTAGNFSPFE